MLEAQTCWSEPLLWVRNVLCHNSGLGTWKNFFHLWLFFQQPKFTFSIPKTLKRRFFSSSTVNLPTLEAHACWSEPLLWARNFLCHNSGLWKWKSFFYLWLLFSSQNFTFSIPKTLKRRFFSSSNLPTLKVPCLLKWAIILSAELFVPLQWTWIIKKVSSNNFWAAKNPFFLTLRPWNPIFIFKFVYSRFSNARSPNLLKRASIVNTELFVPLQ